ncbi:MAG: ABC transporter permease [Burkholderiales bacterium]|nr:ABC transporter permease [Burkholderiales bacterium]
MVRWTAGWWRLIHFAALMLAPSLSRSSYRRGCRTAIAHHMYGGTAPTLPSFTIVSAPASLIVIQIVVVTAQSYVLSKYSLEMVVRVLVMELIPLIAALFAALQYTIPVSSQPRLRVELREAELAGDGPEAERLRRRVVLIERGT